MTLRARLALALMALLALVVATYAPVKHGVFVGDDRALVETNPLVLRGRPGDIFAQPFVVPNPLTDSQAVYYRPLTVLTLRADYARGALDAGDYHVTNLLFHLAAVLALFLTARRLGATPTAAVIAAGLWGLHPRSTEAVAWVSGRADVIAAGCVIAAVGIWPWYADADANANANANARVRAGMAGAALLCALLAKEVAVAAVVAMALGTWVGARRDVRKGMTRLVWLAVPVAAYGALRWNATHRLASSIAPIGGAARAATALEATGRYVEMVALPWLPATGFGLAGEVDRARAALGALALLVGLGLAARALVKWRRANDAPLSPTGVSILVATVLAIGSLALVLHVVPLVLVSAVTADRLLYLPLAGLALGLAVAASRLSPRARTIAGGVAVALAATFVPVTRARATDYTDDIRFRVAAAEHAHLHNPVAKSALANVLRGDAEFDLACRLHASAARSLFAMGPSAAPRYARALENLGSCYEMLGAYDRAAAVYAELLTLRPDSARLHTSIGFLFLHELAWGDAEASLRRALALDPALDSARRTLAAIPATRIEYARLSSDEAARRDERLIWARLLTRIGRVPDATQAWLEVVLDPTTPNGDAFHGLEFVVANGDIATAGRAAKAYAKRNTHDEQLGRELYAKRLQAQASIDALRPRLEALAAR